MLISTVSLNSLVLSAYNKSNALSHIVRCTWHLQTPEIHCVVYQCQSSQCLQSCCCL